jgi:hypothetical protein
MPLRIPNFSCDTPDLLRKQIDELIQRNTPNEDRFSTREAIDQWCSTTSSWRNDSAKVSEPERQRGSTSPDNEQSESEDEKQRMHYHSDRSELTAELKVNRGIKSWQFHPYHKRIWQLGIDLFSKKFRWEFLPLKSLFYACKKYNGAIWWLTCNSFECICRKFYNMNSPSHRVGRIHYYSQQFCKKCIECADRFFSRTGGMVLNRYMFSLT